MSNPAEIHLTSQAIEMTVKIQKDQPQWQGLFLRLYLEGKGCDGFTYGVCFDQRSADDLTSAPYVCQSGEQFELIVDPDTYQFVKGSTIKWEDSEIGVGYLVENPNHKKFRGKFYKRKSWKTRLLS